MFRKTVVLIVAGALSLSMALISSRRAMAEDKKPKSDLSKSMEQIDEGMKKLRRTLRSKDSNAQSLETIAKVEQAALVCKSLTPERATTMPADQQPAFLTEYRKGMAALLMNMCSMETAVLEGDNAKAQDIYKKLKQQEEDGHDSFMPADSDAATKQ
jgi:soluble cytochrome b562